MQTVLSHIVQKRFSQVNEDIATEALTYILTSSEAACAGMTKLLCGIVSDLPKLRFKTQQSEGAIRPDMWGYAETELRVFIENKFWAGLTDNQPVSYLKQLSEYVQPSVLLFIVPAARVQTIWRELNRRLLDAGIPISERTTAPGVACSVDTETGPILAVTSWDSVLSMLEHEAVDAPGTRGDLIQLRALCDAADSDAFTPFSLEEMTDQRTPAFILQLNTIVQEAIDQAVAKNVLITEGLRPQASWERIGRYAKLSGDLKAGGPGIWFGIHFDLWEKHGTTPLWLYFHGSDWGRGQEVRSIIEPWATQNGILSVTYGNDFAIALRVTAGEEKSEIIRILVAKINDIASALTKLPPRPISCPEQE